MGLLYSMIPKNIPEPDQLPVNFHWSGLENKRKDGSEVCAGWVKSAHN